MIRRALVLGVVVLFTVLAVAGAAGCGGGSAPSPPASTASPERVITGFVFAWGPQQPKNVLDTVHGTLTKDMVLASPLTVAFTLDPAEIADVVRRLDAIDFWSYPPRYVSHGDGPRLEPPVGMRNSAVLTVVTDRGSKTVRWSGGFYADDQRARDLRDLGGYIARLVTSSPGYKVLPPAEGGYL